MKKGQFYGTIGSQGYAAVYREIYDEFVDQQAKQNIALEKQNQQIRQMVLQYDRIAERTLKFAKDARLQSAQVGGVSPGVLSQFFMAEINAFSKLEEVKSDLEKSGIDADRDRAEQLKAIEEKYDQRNSTTASEQSAAARKAITPLQSGANKSTINNAIDLAISSFQNQVYGMGTEERRGEQLARIQYLRNFIADALTNKVGVTKASAGTLYLDSRLAEEFGILQSDIVVFDEKIGRNVTNRDLVQNLKADEELAIIEQSSLSDRSEGIQKTFDDVQDAREQLQGSVLQKGATKSARIFRNPELIEFFEAQNATGFAGTKEQYAEAVAQSTGKDAESILEMYDKAVGIYNSNKALVPEQYLDNLDEGFIDAKREATRLRGQIQTPGPTEGRQNLEQLAAQRFLATTPRPAITYTRADIKRVKKESSVYGQGKREVEYLLRTNPEYKMWYNGLSRQEQAMQSYGVAATQFYDDMGVDEPRPKGRVQKQAAALYEANPNLSSTEIISKTAELFKNPGARDEARAYYAALSMHKANETSPDAEVTKVAEEPIETPQMTPTNLPHSMFEFPFPGRMERQRDREFNRTMRELERDDAQRQREEDSAFARLERRVARLPDFNVENTPRQRRRLQRQIARQEAINSLGDPGGMFDLDVSDIPLSEAQMLDEDYQRAFDDGNF